MGQSGEIRGELRLCENYGEWARADKCPLNGGVTGLVPRIFRYSGRMAANVDELSGNCYIKKVPRVQFRLPVVSCE